jgi:hypothetical protein
MAIAFNPVANDGTGTLVSESLEGLLFEAAFNLQDRETTTPNSVVTVAANPGFGNNVATITANIPITIVPDAVEGFIFKAVAEPAAVGAGYTKTAGLALKGASLNSAILESAQRLQAIERAANPASDEIQVTINTETLTAVVAASLRFTVSVDGSVLLNAAPFIDNGL